ncbi:hypothetical protein, partial [Siccirubricoccus deserti]
PFGIRQIGGVAQPAPIRRTPMLRCPRHPASPQIARRRRESHPIQVTQSLFGWALSQSENLQITNYKGANSHSFELYLGLFMGMKGMDTENMRSSGNNSWMVSTWRAFGCDFRPQDGFSRLLKADRFLFGLPFLPTKFTALSPSFAHFIGLRPRRLYDRLSAHFRSEARKRLALCESSTR